MERADPSEVLGDVCHFRLSKRRSDRGLMSSLPGQLGFGIGSAEPDLVDAINYSIRLL